MALLDRRKNEDKTAHAGRVLYLEMGAERSFTKVAKKIDRTRRTVVRWASKHNWSQAAFEYDSMISGVRHDAVIEGNRAAAQENARLIGALNEIELRRAAFESISSRFDELLEGLIKMALGASSEQVKLRATRHVLALVGVQPVKRIEQHTELSGSLGVDASVSDVAEDELEAILEALPMETVRALDDAYHSSPEESAAQEASPDHQDGEAPARLH